MKSATIFAFGIAALAPKAFTSPLYEHSLIESSPRQRTLGVGALAVPATRRGAILLSPSNGLDPHYQLGAAYDIGSGTITTKIKGEPAYRVKRTRQDHSTYLYGTIPLARFGDAESMSGFAVSNHAMTSKNKDKGTYRGGDETTEDDTSLLGVFAWGPATLGCRMTWVRYKTNSTNIEPVTNDTPPQQTESYQQGSTNYTAASFYTGLAATENLRLALAYSPRKLADYSEAYTNKVRNATTGATINEYKQQNREATGRGESMALAGAYTLPGLDMMVTMGVARDFPSESRLDQYSTHDFLGVTTVSAAMEFGVDMFNPRFGLANSSTRYGDVRRLTAGSDIFFGPLIAGVDLGYDWMEGRYEKSRTKSDVFDVAVSLAGRF